MRRFEKSATFVSFQRAGETPGHRRRETRATTRRSRPVLDELEGRVVLSTLSSITSNFNGTAIPVNDSVWFSSVAKVQGVGSSPVTIRVEDQTITFKSNGVLQTLNAPDTVLVLSPTATSAATTFDTGTNTWQTTAPASLGGNVFLDGLSFTPAGGLPGGIKNVTWTGAFSTDTAGVKVNWQWAAAVYSQFGTENNSLGVKPVDSSTLSAYKNSDHAGTPEGFKSFVVGGARGGGGSNYTGSYSGTATVILDVVAQAPPASLSGYVFGVGGTGIAGVAVTLTGTDDQGDAITEIAMTDTQGHYVFSDLGPGSYTIEEPDGYGLTQSYVGTVDGSPDGSVTSTGDIAQILLEAGDQGINYNFRAISE